MTVQTWKTTPLSYSLWKVLVDVYAGNLYEVVLTRKDGIETAHYGDTLIGTYYHVSQGYIVEGACWVGQLKVDETSGVRECIKRQGVFNV